jgi:hypothetical protein
MPARLGNVLELVRIGIHTPRRHFMQQRLPQVSGRAVDQNNLSLALLAELITQTSYQLKTTSATAHHNDTMRPSGWRRFKHWSRMGHSFHEYSIDPHENIHAGEVIFTKVIFYFKKQIYPPVVFFDMTCEPLPGLHCPLVRYFPMKQGEQA